MPLYDNEKGTFGEYDLFSQSLLFLVEKEDPALPLTRLLCYSIGEPNLDTAAKVQIPVCVMKNGQIITQLKTVRNEIVRSYSFPIGFPPGNWLRGPLGRLVKNLSGCEKDFWLVNLCADECNRFALHLPEGRMSALVPGALITVDEDGTPITATSNLDVLEPRATFWVEPRVVANVGAASAQALAVIESECADCDDCPCQEVVVGGDESADVTTTGFGGVTAFSGTIPLGAIITDWLQIGDLALATYTDDLDPALATAGGILIFDLNDPTADPTNVALADGMFSLAYATNSSYVYVAVGASGSLYSSNTGATWSAIAHTTVLPSAHFLDAVLDEDAGVVWITGDDGAGGPAIAYLSGTTLVNLTADVVADTSIAGAITAFNVVDDEYYWLGTDAGEVVYGWRPLVASGDWNLVPSPSEVAGDSVNAIVGDRGRVFVGTDGPHLYERSIVTEYDWIDRLDGIVGSVPTGDVTDIVACNASVEIFDGLNYLYAATSAGDIIYISPCESVC